VQEATYAVSEIIAIWQLDADTCSQKQSRMQVGRIIKLFLKHGRIPFSIHAAAMLGLKPHTVISQL
jgi:hypothetical protein